MSELSILMNRLWISKKDPDFYPIKSYLRKNKEELSELLHRFGWRITSKPNLIYIRKQNNTITQIRNHGIPGFKSREDYLNLMMIFMYLTHPAHNIIFTLEEILEYMKIIIQEEELEIDVTSRYFSYSLYRTLTYMEEIDLLERMDGKLTDLFEKMAQIPGILYKNTGLCHSFMQAKHPDEELSTKQKLYQKLFSQTLVKISEKEYQILKHDGDQLEDDFKMICDEDAELIFDKTYAYINHKEGNYFPNENNRKDWLIMRVCKKLKENNADTLSRERFCKLLDQIRVEDSLYWTQEMIKWGNRSYERYVLSQLINHNFVWELDKVICVHPAIFHMNL